MTGLMGQDNGKDGFDEMKDNRTDNIVECAYNMDNGYVEVWFTDGNMLRIKCEGVEAALRTTEQSLAKLHRLLDNKPIEYVVMALSGEIQAYCDIEVKKEAGGKGEIYITTKKTKAVEKTIAKGNMKVEGKVVDEQGEPVIGAAVLIEGTTTGSVTDVNGNFVLSVPSKDAVLVVSYIGMATGKVKVQPKLTITLKSE